MSGIRRRLLYAKSKKVPNYLCFTALESGTFTLTIDANLSTSALQYIEYSLDGNTWVKTDNVNSQSVTITTPTIANGGKVYWRGIGDKMANNFSNNPSIFSSTCRFDASGEVMSLLKGENFTKSRNVGNSAFARLFKDCSTIVNAKDLTIEIGTIGSYGLQEMFVNCTSLITTPYISNFNGPYAFSGMFKGCSSLVEVTYPLPVPSTVSNRSYRNMFEGCTALVKTPNLPLTDFGNNAYMNMFKGCTSLTIVSTLPATSLTDSCYQNMFDGCTSIVDAPFLPATNIPGSAYSAMFAGCTNLKNVPDINVSSFAGTYNMSLMFYNCSSLVHCPIKSVPNDAPVQCFNSMFRGCTNLVDAFELPALVLNIYSYGSLFRDTKVSYIKMLATDISANGCLGSWVSRVPSSGIFVKNINATWTNVGESGVPSGWTVIYYDPAVDKYYTDQTRATECDDHGNPLVNPNYKIVPMEIEIYGKYQNRSSNTLSDNASYCTTYYYELEDFDSVSLFPETMGAYSFVYDENYDRLGSVTNINNKDIKSVYPTAKYVRFSGDTNNNMKNPFMVFYNTTNYVQSEYALPKTSNIKLFKPEIAIRGKYLPATGVETNMGNYSISEYYEIVADRFQPYLNRNRSYCHAYDANEEWLFNLSTNTSIKGRDANATYIRVSEETARMETDSYFGVMYNFENVL